VDQISLPFRIALVAMLAVCALWFTVLKPKDPAAVSSTPTAPGVTGLGNDVKAAKDAAAKSDAANAKVQAATGGTTATTSKSAPATKSAAKKGDATVATKKGGTAPAAKKAKAKAATVAPAASLLSALDRKDTVVLLFRNARASDDRAVEQAVKAVDRHNGRVVVKVAPIESVARYEAITRGVEVMQSPTVLVIGPDHKARAVVGFTTTREVDQVVADTLAAAKK
jgi:hypothetical protein